MVHQPGGWPRWMLNQLDEADSVLVVCTETYYRRFRGHEEPGKGKGADWEGALITQEIYDDRSETLKFVPILFTPKDELFIPEPIRGLTYYVLNSEHSYNELYDFLLGQGGVEPRAVGKARVRERRKGTTLKFEPSSDSVSQTEIAPSRLHHGADRLFGREQELAALDEVSADPTKKVLTIVAFGGVGKTSLIIEWMARQAAKNWEGFERVFDWSFFSQGTREEGGASADTFIAAALRFFGDEAMADSSASAWDKGARLAQLVAQQRSLLVLDGIEPLQHPPGPSAGELKDPALAMFLKGLARQNSGLCIVTTRERVTDLASFRDTTAPEWALHHLSTSPGVELLKNLGVRGTRTEFEELVKEVKGHALTLNLLGRYLAKAHQGDIRKRDQVKFEKADAKIQGGYAFKTIGAYETWLREGGDDGARALAVLRLLGLFDRPADSGCLNALRRDPPIEDLTTLLTGLDDADWNIAVTSLVDCGLVSVQSNGVTIRSSQSAIDAHPLIREYFAKQLKEKNAEGWRGAHRRLYKYLCQTTTDQKPEPTLEDLQPLYQAVAHGCQAGLQQEACDEVYFARIKRGEKNYSTRKLGAFGADLGAIACFFEIPWSRVSPTLAEADQAWTFGESGFYLRALGRLTEALEPTRAAVVLMIKQNNWREAASCVSNLSELELILGELDGAVGNGKQSVVYAESSGDVFLRLYSRTTHADALYQAGSWAEAQTLFNEAEQIQSKHAPNHPLLYSVQGFRHCDLLLAAPEIAAWQVVHRLKVRCQQSELLNLCRAASDHAAQTLKWGEGKIGILSVAVDHLTLGRATLYEAIIDKAEIRNSRSEIETAVDGLRRADQQPLLVLGLLTRTWHRFLAGACLGPESAQADLDEAWEIAERGPMRLHMADIHLYRARLFGPLSGKMTSEAERIEYPWNKNPDGSPRGPLDDLRAARKLIEQCGYWRRKEELEDAEEASKNW
jgi:tetratricopeptide (TPR) repeat protein